MDELDQNEAPPWAHRPAWADRLLAEVEDEFALTSAGDLGWPDPHETADPAQLAYSVCSDPDKYRILDERIEAWSRILLRLELAVLSAPAPGADWVAARRPPDQVDRVWKLTPTVQRGLTLWFARTLVDRQPFGIDIGVGGEDLSTVFFASVPDCGCDACDDGSRPVLDAIDSAVLTIARGGVVHARDDHRHATAGINSWHTTDHAPEAWLDADQPVPRTVQRWRGEPWLTV